MKEHPRYKELLDLKNQEKALSQQVSQLEAEIKRDIARDEKVEIMGAVKDWLESGGSFRWQKTWSQNLYFRKKFIGENSRADLYVSMHEYQGSWRITQLYLGYSYYYIRISKDILAPMNVSTPEEAKAWANEIVLKRLQNAVRKTIG